MKRLVLAAAICFITFTQVSGRTLWNNRSLYTSGGDLRVGGVLVIDVNDVSSMRFTLNMNNQSATNVSSNPASTITGFLPRVNSDKKITNDDNTKFTSKGQLRFSMAARVLNQAANGLYAVAGSKTLTVNGVTNIITVTGLVDPALVKGRHINAARVADFTLEIRGVREGLNIERPPLEEDEQAEATLTEAEKQQIIIDYLETMVRELTR